MCDDNAYILDWTLNLYSILNPAFKALIRFKDFNYRGFLETYYVNDLIWRQTYIPVSEKTATLDHLLETNNPIL